MEENSVPDAFVSFKFQLSLVVLILSLENGIWGLFAFGHPPLAKEYEQKVCISIAEQSMHLIDNKTSYGFF